MVQLCAEALVKIASCCVVGIIDLVALKSKYDPKNLLRLNANIKPTT